MRDCYLVLIGQKQYWWKQKTFMDQNSRQTSDNVLKNPWNNPTKSTVA